jgi:Flp pilus assembly protein TadG
MNSGEERKDAMKEISRHLRPSQKFRRRLRRRGNVAIYTIIAMPILLMVVGLSFDWGRVQLTRVELNRACDGAARNAANGISDGTALTKANYVAGLNTVDGQTITLTSSNVQTGTWNANTRTFTAGGTSPNAVRVTMSKTVPATFASLAGGTPKTVIVRAVAKLNPIGLGLIGLEGVTFKGHATASYSSTGGSGSTSAGSIASNGAISVGGSSTVNGNVYLGPGGSVSGGNITGTTTNLSSPLSFPNGSADPYGPTNNDNIQIPNLAMAGTSFNLGNNKSVTIPGGNYYFNDFNMGGGSSLNVTGPTTIYCYGSFTMSGNTSTFSSIPGNLKIVMVPNPFTGAAPGSVSIGGGGTLYASFYAPQSDITMSGSGDLYGGVLGKTFSMTGTGSIYYDTALDANGGTISLVQ